MFKKLLPWSLRGVGPFLNTYGDALFFRGVRATPPMRTNPQAEVGLHSPIPRRYVHAYLLAVKSFLRYHDDVAVYVHDDGSLRAEDKDLIRRHLIGVNIVDRAAADARFERMVSDPFLHTVRKSYSSYLKLFDPTLTGSHARIVLLDSDTLFLQRPDAVIGWCREGGAPWYHMAPPGRMKGSGPKPPPGTDTEAHIQTLIMRELKGINTELERSYRISQGFCAGFVGYERGTVRIDELGALFHALYRRFGERIFRWGAEQTVHGLTLCAHGAQALPIEEYFVFTQTTASRAAQGTFVHFVGENRFHRLLYPRLGRRVSRELCAAGFA
jgi:hypothetical protein